MLRVLLAAGVQPDFVVGASVGAMNAAYFAGAPNAEGVARLAEIWSRLRRREVFPVTFKSAFGLLRRPESVIDSGGLRHLIETNLAYARLEDAMVPVHVIATDVEGMAVVFSKGPAIDAILASTAIPGIFPPVRIDGQTLMDGAVARNSPIRVAADLGASRIVVLPTGYACALDEPPKGAMTWALHAITLLRALENGSMAAASRGDPGLPNLRRTTIEWLTVLPSQRSGNSADSTFSWKTYVQERPI